jgi:hypothetical protein
MIPQLSAFFGAFLGSSKRKPKMLSFFYAGVQFNGSNKTYMNGVYFIEPKHYNPETFVILVKEDIAKRYGCSPDSMYLHALTPLSSK